MNNIPRYGPINNMQWIQKQSLWNVSCIQILRLKSREIDGWVIVLWSRIVWILIICFVSIAGVLYFLSSTVNPILYNLLSRKFRYAFKRTFCRCCLNLEAFPTFYKLKAIFINKNEQPSSTPSGMRYLFPQKPIVLDTFYQKHNRRSSQSDTQLNQGSTKETLLKVSTGCGSSSGTHAHSDGRLHCLCRHKSCSSHRTRQSIESQMFCKQFNNASYQDIETLKRLHCFRDECHLKSFDSVPETPEKNLAVNLL